MRAIAIVGLWCAAAFAATPALADCQCRANGRIFHHGEVACLHLPSGPQLAQCGMVLNNSSWIKLQDGCPVAAMSESQETPASRPGVPPLPICRRDTLNG
jgi:hypothetical protein